MKVFFSYKGKRIEGDSLDHLWAVLKFIDNDVQSYLKSHPNVENEIDKTQIKKDFTKNFLKALEAYVEAKQVLGNKYPGSLPKPLDDADRGLKLLVKGPKTIILSIKEPWISDLFYVGYLILPVLMDKEIPSRQRKYTKPDMDEMWDAGYIPYPFLYKKKKIKRISIRSGNDQ